MRIGVDGYNIGLPDGTGVARYGLVLARTLREMEHEVDGVFGFRAFRAESFARAFYYPPPPRPRSRIRVVAHWARAYTGTWGFPIDPERDQLPERLSNFSRFYNRSELFVMANRIFRKFGRFAELHLPDPPDIMHWTYPVPVRVKGVPNIYTIHDIIPLKLPWMSVEDKARYHDLVQCCIDTGELICTVSNNSRTDILEEFSASPERIMNCYQSSHLFNTDIRDPMPTLRENGLERGQYFIFCGTIEPKKNLGRLLDAYLAAGTRTPLVIVAKNGWRGADEEDVAERLNSLNGASSIRHIGHQPEAVLQDLIVGAKAMLFPSLYEGFGLPILEAMLLGVPVLTSRIGAIPEVTADAALLVNPYDVGAISQAILQLDQNEALRLKLAGKGLANAQRFSPSNYAGRLETLYETAAAAHAPTRSRWLPARSPFHR